MTREFSVTEATEWAAFVSDTAGFDVAVVQRLPAQGFEAQAPITDDEWQSMVDLFAAAPSMLFALREIAEECERRLRKGEDSGDRLTLRLCRVAIARTEGRTEQ